MSAISPLGREAGIILAILGLLIMVISRIRFTDTNNRIQSESHEIYSFKSVLLTGGIFILLAIFVLFFITRFLS